MNFPKEGVCGHDWRKAQVERFDPQTDCGGTSREWIKIRQFCFSCILYNFITTGFKNIMQLVSKSTQVLIKERKQKQKNKHEYFSVVLLGLIMVGDLWAFSKAHSYSCFNAQWSCLFQFSRDPPHV